MVSNRQHVKFVNVLLDLRQLAEEAGGAVLAVTLDEAAYKALSMPDVERCPCCGGERVVTRMAGIEINGFAQRVAGGKPGDWFWANPNR